MSDTPKSIICPCCHQSTIPGLRKTDLQVLKRLDQAAPGSLSKAQMVDGLNVDPASVNVILDRIKKRIAPHGFQIVNTVGVGAGRRGEYRLETARVDQAETQGRRA